MDINHNLAVVCKNLMFKQPFYGLLLLNLQKEWCSKIQTAGVGLNGLNYKLKINPEFWESLSEDHKYGLLQHELMHIAFFHITEYKHLKNREIANVAMDLEINQGIPEKNLPTGGVTLKNFEDLDLLQNEGTNTYYKKLMKEEEKKEEEQGGGQSLSDMIKEALAEGEGSIDMNGSPMDIPDHNWDDFTGLTEAEEKLIDRQLAQTLSNVVEQVKKSQGHIPSNVEILLEKHLKIEPPKFNWKAYVRRFVGNSIKSTVRKTKRKQSKRFELDFGIRIQEHSHILIGIDSSASVSDKEIHEFMNEIKHMNKTGHQFTIIFADTQMQEPFVYKPNAQIVIKKRGGTDFNPVVDYYHQHKNRFSTLIYLTDGEAPLPNNPVKNMLWVLSTISGDADHLKESGKVIKLN